MMLSCHFISERINIRVIDPFTIKPLDSKTIIEHARATRGRIITVEDHYYEGGYLHAVTTLSKIRCKKCIINVYS